MHQVGSLLTLMNVWRKNMLTSFDRSCQMINIYIFVLCRSNVRQNELLPGALNQLRIISLRSFSRWHTKSSRPSGKIYFWPTFIIDLNWLMCPVNQWRVYSDLLHHCTHWKNLQFTAWSIKQGRSMHVTRPYQESVSADLFTVRTN